MNIHFGTDGLRGLVGEELTALIAYKVGRYLGFQATMMTHRQLVVGMDTRLSSSMLAYACIAGIQASGGHVTFLEVVTTPVIAFAMMQNKFDFGVMISASHNPYYDNGIKIFNHQGEKLDASTEKAIEQYCRQSDDLPHAVNEKVGQLIIDSQIIDAYLNFLVAQVTLPLPPLKLLADLSYGSASRIFPLLASRLGLNVEYIGQVPNGVNINDQVGATHMQTLAKAMKKQSFDLGVAFDGDGDRMLAVDEMGQIIDGDGLMYIHAQQTLPLYPSNKQTVVLTKMSNLGLKKALTNLNIGYTEVDVGDKYVHAALKAQGLILGGEQSGHVMFLDVLPTGDGLLSFIKLLAVMQTTKKPISSLLTNYFKYPQLLKNVIVKNKSAVLTHAGFQPLITSIEQALGDDGRILVRPSGTEPMIRVMVEAKSPALCQQYVQEVVDWIQQTFMDY